jgi:hypothetical protein
VPKVLVAVAQGHAIVRPPHDVTDIATRAILDDETTLNLYLGIPRPGALLSELLEDVAFGSPGHPTSVSREPF